jgi:hypothetical protein
MKRIATFEDRKVAPRILTDAGHTQLDAAPARRG